MITRRNFIVTSAATASSPLALDAAASEAPRLPLRALPRVRRLRAEPTSDGRLLLLSDGPKTPPKLIKPEALERVFGPGTDGVLSQPDHWRMIDEGWFVEEDLEELTDPNDPALMIWQANYRPEVEAHDLLYDLFRDRIKGPFGAYIPEVGLELGEHPATPRFATAKVNDEFYLSLLAAEVTALTSWLEIEAHDAEGAAR